ncbi:hypothetical protein N7E81_11200 [Reichenbachiella carrageenanivorans]|uniref:MG2 domain-containing protein n=1 Tax=Reichenbachiella carrageenanivorans TaxID=2979869 RepID=A0ABY6CVJ4_9BACT|nr:hypothetical protein [Reichenbachiella carrageenanivorans]UXX77932.1 hypothetical protein N7E81_11200 [Reichenbachiella carrageenanivorans]
MRNVKLKRFTVASLVCLLALNCFAQDHLFLKTNKTIYVVGEQVHFDFSRMNDLGQVVEKDEETLVSVDLVAPDGRIVQTKSILPFEDSRYFFSLGDTLLTGIYRVVANGVETTQAVSNIHVLELELQEKPEQQITSIEAYIRGGILTSSQYNFVALRVMDQNGAGMATKGTLVNAQDSLVQYIDTDLNGIASVAFMAIDSVYKVRFGAKTYSLHAKERTWQVEMSQSATEVECKLTNLLGQADTVTWQWDDEPASFVYLSATTDTVFRWTKQDLSFGLHRAVLGVGAERSVYPLMVRPDTSLQLGLKSMKLQHNVQHEFTIDGMNDQIDYVEVSILDEASAQKSDFYESFYFDQLGLDLQWVENRDFDAYLEVFHQQLSRVVNVDRLSTETIGGAYSYQSNFPFDEVSMLNLQTMKTFDIRNEYIHGLHDFEQTMSSRSQVFPYHFTTYLQPLEPVNLKEKVNYTYPVLKTVMQVGAREQQIVQAYDMQRNIMLSYQESETESAELPAADYVYDLTDYEVPNTMEELINYIIKYVSVVKNKEGKKDLSMFRHMSSYKYRGIPLIFLNNLPTYDLQTILNLNAKDFAKVEVRNSYQANAHLGNFSLNGSVSFYLKDGVDNPLEDAYKDLPVLTPCENFHKKASDSEFAPDFRHQLFWNPKLVNKNQSFWVDLKTSDLSTTYKVLVTAYMKDGTVIQDSSSLLVE